MDPKAKKGVFLGFKRGVKGYKVCDPKDKIIFSMDITLDKASMIKLTDSQQVESKKSTEVSQQVKSDVTSRTPHY